MDKICTGIFVGWIHNWRLNIVKCKSTDKNKIVVVAGDNQGSLYQLIKGTAKDLQSGIIVGCILDILEKNQWWPEYAYVASGDNMSDPLTREELIEKIPWIENHPLTKEFENKLRLVIRDKSKIFLASWSNIENKRKGLTS